MEMITSRSKRFIKFPITPEVHAAIVQVYQTGVGNGGVKILAIKLGYPRWKITRYAIQLGLIAKQKKESPWTDKEVRILEKNAHYCPEIIRKKLGEKGFTRTCTGIVLKRKRMRLLQNLDGMNANGLAECLGVDRGFVIRAIRMGKIRAEKRGTDRVFDEWFIRNGDIRAYILEYLNEIDLRKVQKFWFTDLLVHGGRS